MYLQELKNTYIYIYKKNWQITSICVQKTNTQLIHKKTALSLCTGSQYSTCAQETNTQLEHRKPTLNLSTENQYSTCAQKTNAQLVHGKPASIWGLLTAAFTISRFQTDSITQM